MRRKCFYNDVHENCNNNKNNIFQKIIILYIMIRMDSTRKKGNIYNGQMHSLNAPFQAFVSSDIKQDMKHLKYDWNLG